MTGREANFKTLSEVGSIGRGKSKHRPRNDPRLYGGQHPFVQTSDVKHAGLHLTNYSQTYSDLGLEQSKLWPAETLCITIAANIGDTAILGIPACFPDSILGFVADPDASNVRYVKYCLDGFKEQIQLISRGTTQDNLSLDKLLKLRFWFPNVQVQEQIAAILSAYDDRIANNQRRIALLEFMAEEIYREWFVRMRVPGHDKVSKLKGIPSTWKIARIGEIFQTTSGGTPSRGKAENFDGDIPWVKTGELKSLFVHETEERLTQRGIDSSAARVLPRHTVVMAMYCAMPDVTLLGVPAATNQACCALLPREGYLGHTYCYYFAKYALSQMVGFAHGAAQQNLSQEIIRKFQVLHPDPALISLYSERTSALFGLAETLMRVNSELERTRDALLPRLISGKLKVDHLDIQLPPAMREKVTA